MKFRLVFLFLLSFPLVAKMGVAQKAAVTFDDLPLNGDLPPGVTRVQIAREVVAWLKAQHLSPVYGFINAAELEGNSDAAEALKIWATSEAVGNHNLRPYGSERKSGSSV
jgi:hypothetical protein